MYIYTYFKNWERKSGKLLPFLIQSGKLPSLTGMAQMLDSFSVGHLIDIAIPFRTRNFSL